MGTNFTRPIHRAQRAPQREGTILKRSPRDELSPAEARYCQDLDRQGRPYVLYRDNARQLRVLPLQQERLIVGRDQDADVPLPWDRAVSRRHAALEHNDEGWYVVDDGMSTNGTMVNGERIRGRRFLRDRDVVQVGESGLAFCDPAMPTGMPTLIS
jgi:pSer/pThr/pTyr-binding forkhead associated (FHA) protein